MSVVWGVFKLSLRERVRNSVIWVGVKVELLLPNIERRKLRWLRNFWMPCFRPRICLRDFVSLLPV